MVNHSFTTGSITGRFYIGGLVGTSRGSVSKCYATGSVTGAGLTGGLVGSIYHGSLNMCYAIGCVEGRNNDVGGLVGSNSNSTVSESYALGSVTGYEKVGGLVGSNYDGLITDCYATSGVTGSDYFGGLIGWNDSGSIISSTFWDIETSGLTQMCGRAISPCNDAYGITTKNMQDPYTFLKEGWDFVSKTTNGTDNIWRMCINGVDYPRLAWEFLPGDCACPDGVALDDFSYFSSRFLETGCDTKNNCGLTDINHDHLVNLEDFIILCEQWLAE